VDSDTALGRMQVAAALWSVGQVSAAEMVDLACELLVTGFDGFNVAMLAGVHARHADEDVPELLEAALADVGLSYYARDSHTGQEAAVRVDGRNADPKGRTGREADLAVVVVPPVHGHLVAVAAHATPQPQPRRITQVAEVQLVPAVPDRGRQYRSVRRRRIDLVAVHARRPRLAHPLGAVRGDERLQIGGHRLQHVRVSTMRSSHSRAR